MSGKTTSIPTTEPAVILESYAFRGYAEVRAFLETNPFLTPLLVEAASVIPRYFGPSTQTVLEVVHDPEGGIDSAKLFAFIQTNESAEETLAKLDRLDREWWIDASTQAHCRLIISVE